MKNYGWKYVFLVLGTGGFFTNFIACGTQLYHVSVEEDFDLSQQAASNPHMTNPDSTMYGIHTVSGWKNLPVVYHFDPTLDGQQRRAVQDAMAKWEWAVGKKLFSYSGEHSGTTGDSFKDLYSSLDDDVNGHYADGNWEKTAKPTYVLATTIWNNSPDYSAITKADVRFNTEHYIIGDSLRLRATETREVVDMQSLATHELGHLLGLAHIAPEVDRLSIMNPSLLIGEGLTTRHISRGDILRIQMIYGCSGRACDVDALLEEEAEFDRKTRISQTDASTQAH